MSKLPGGVLLRGGRNCIFPVEVRPFLFEDELEAKGEWQVILQGMLNVRVRQCKGPLQTMSEFLEDIGYETTGPEFLMQMEGYPWFNTGMWEMDPVKLAALMADLDMGA